MPTTPLKSSNATFSLVEFVEHYTLHTVVQQHSRVGAVRHLLLTDYLTSSSPLPLGETLRYYHILSRCSLIGAR